MPGRIVPLTGGQQGFKAGRKPGVVVRKPLQQLCVERDLSVGVAQAGAGVQPHDPGQVGRRRVGVHCRALKRRDDRTGTRRRAGGHEARQGVVQHLGVDRFAEMAVHAQHQATLPFVGHGVGRHGDDGQVDVALIKAQQPRGFIAVHHRHLQVHQHHAEMPGRTRVDMRYTFLSVAGDIDLHATALHQFYRKLLVDWVVFHQQDAQAGEILDRRCR